MGFGTGHISTLALNSTFTEDTMSSVTATHSPRYCQGQKIHLRVIYGLGGESENLTVPHWTSILLDKSDQNHTNVDCIVIVHDRLPFLIPTVLVFRKVAAATNGQNFLPIGGRVKIICLCG